MTRWIVSLWIVVLGSIASICSLSCEFLSDDVTSKPLNGKVVFWLEENQYRGSESSAKILLRAETEAVYGCDNYQIAHTVEKFNRTIELSIFDVFIGEMCATAIGPARFDEPIVLQPGEYSLRFSHNGMTDTYSVLSTDSTLEVLPGSDTAFTRLIHNIVRK